MIAFLQPLALLALAVAALPTVLHLLTRRVPPTVTFPAVRYPDTSRRPSARGDAGRSARPAGRVGAEPATAGPGPGGARGGRRGVVAGVARPGGRRPERPAALGVFQR
ncbi:MAG: BatA domain-containing protein [Gemmatimonadetes bacterium]|nr:BatA domain-containing protein [Gemmatimonadota bacterium]